MEDVRNPIETLTEQIDGPIDIVLRPKQLTQGFALVVIGLTIMHIVGKLASLIVGHDIVGFSLFNIGRQRNILDFYSAVALLFCALLLTLITVASNRRGRPYVGWTGLAAIFCFLALDESVGIHETLSPLQSVLHTSGLLYFAWVIPYGIVLAIITLAYLRFIRALPPRIRRLFITAGSIYILGAVGFEMLEGWYSEIHNQGSSLYTLLTTVEEVLEMSGIVVFIYALSSYIDSELCSLRLCITSSTTRRP